MPKLTIPARLVAGLALIPVLAIPSHPDRSHQSQEATRWQQHVANVTITRDTWGIAHVRGKTDADAVFGMIYAQAEDDFNRIETNYLNAMGRMAEAEGEPAVFRDLRMRLFIGPDSLHSWYHRSPQWLQELMTAWADGLNFYLSKHPDVRPRVLTRFEPWMALSFTEGSIGGDIERISIPNLRAFYGGGGAPSLPGDADADVLAEPTGSNGIAIAPSNTVNKRALLLINPHTSFYFRSELQMTSDAGLNAYGAATWGQFFIYQGFNESAGWMHTSSGVDNIDEYLETIVQGQGGPFYRHGVGQRPVGKESIRIRYRTDSGMAERTFTIYRTAHGPVVRQLNGKWVTVSLMQEPIKALTQSYTRTKARNYEEFQKTMELHTNSSNNTIFADSKGNIAYLHANFIPKRDPQFDWSRPVEGSDPATDWHGVLSFAETPNILNPASGWIYNSNNWPWSAAGPSSPKRESFPSYVETGREESPRGLHAIRVLENRRDFTVEALRAAAYDSYLPAFERLIPPLVAAWDKLPETDPLKATLRESVGLLRAWDYRWSESSVPTAVAIFWADTLLRNVASAATRVRMSALTYGITQATPAERLSALWAAMQKLNADFGSWRTPWGEINRFQRLNDEISPSFDDQGSSIPVGFTSGNWGSLASFGARPYSNTKRWYGSSGNSFVAVVEFGDSVRAVAVTAGGLSGDPKSPHFNDQAKRYSTGDLREVYFYPSKLAGHVERAYHPGE
jgi:acyl-homoserine lactone acylase PvdQ